MLKSLHIKNYALIDELNVEFVDGLNIITGETGAGKSILLGALQLLMGSRASTEVVRTGSTKAFVEGIFDPKMSVKVAAVLKTAEVDSLPDLIVRREISGSHSRAFVNDSPVTLSVLRDLADCMIDLHGQHQHQSLLREDSHRSFVDEIGGFGPLIEAYRKIFEEIGLVRRQRTVLMNKKRAFDERRELAEFQLSEIDSVEMRIGEDDELEREVSVLDNAEIIKSVTDTVHAKLYESEGAIVDQLSAIHKEIESIVRYDPYLESLSKEVRSAIITLQEVATASNDYASRIEYDPERLARLRQRIGDYDRLRKKYGGTVEDVIDRAEKLRQDLTESANFEEQIEDLDAVEHQLRERLGEAARDLSDRRKKAAIDIERQIIEALAELNINRAIFRVQFSNVADVDGWVVIKSGDRVKAFPDGIDRVNFYISTNPGEAAKPLVDVASGGEISRVMLALKSILARTGAIPLMVFDEIDVGISGRVAQQVGKKLRELSANHQVISITHLPQIAAMADRHFIVEKTVSNNRTESRLRQLRDEERPKTIASLIGGSTVTEAAIRSARELIESAQVD